MKKWYLSKTLWFNFFTGILFVAKPELAAMIGGEVGLATLFSVVNLVLRSVTKDGLQIK